MSPPSAIRAKLVALAGTAALCAPAVAWAQSAQVQPRTGPEAAPPAPAYAQPAPALVSPPGPGAGAAAPSSGGPAITEIRVAADTPGAAIPPAGWRPAAEEGGDLRLEHNPGEALDEAWVRRQFALNGLPGPGGVSRALALVQTINRAYIGAGFINSGLIVRGSPALGVLELGLIYGGVTPPAEGQPAVSVIWTGGRSKGLDAGYVRDRMPSAAERPLSAVDLERDFRLLAEDPAIRTINADLRPGARPGEASLALSIYPQDRFDFYVTAANNRAPAVGGERLSAGGSVRNALAAGDLLSGEAGVTDGVKDLTVSYAIPFLSPRNTLAVRGQLNNAAVTDTLLTPLDIRARDRLIEGGITRKLIDAPLLPTATPGRWSSARTLTVGGQISWRQSTAFLLGERFSFAPGSENGRSRYTVGRILGDYVVRNVDQVFAISVTGTMGLEGTRSDVPGAPSPKQHFVAVLSQANYARRLDPHGLELRARLTGQWANSLLYSGERISAGGEYTVRGYRENLLLADKGLIGSVELARPISLSGRKGAAPAFDWGAFTVSAFADGALMRNDKPPQPVKSIYGVGVSLAWTPSEAFSARITFAQDLKKVEFAGNRDLQDRGVQFRVTFRPLRGD